MQLLVARIGEAAQPARRGDRRPTPMTPPRASRGLRTDHRGAGSGVPTSSRCAAPACTTASGCWRSRDPDRTGAEGLRGTRSSSTPRPSGRRRRGRVVRGRARRPQGRRTPRRRARHGERAPPRAGAGPARRDPDGRGRAYVPFVAAIVPEVDLGGRVVHRPAARPARSTPTEGRRADAMLIDVVTIFPEYLAPLDLSLIGTAREAGLLDVRVHDLRDFTHDRHRTVDDTPYGGGAGMVMRPEPWGEALDAVLASRGEGARPHLIVPTPAGRRSPRRWRASWRRSRGWRSPAAATRGSTSGCYEEARDPMPVSTRSPSATTSSTAARWPCWPWSRPWRGCCRASSATPSPSSRSRTRTACWSTPSTPSRRAGADARCPTCCCPATTRRSPAGAGTSGCGAPRSAART